MDRIELQSKEFDAAERFAQALGNLPCVVDDDYPAMRSQYEGAAYSLLRAMKANGRFDQIADKGELTCQSDLTLEQIISTNARRCEAWHKGDKPWSIERWITATVGEGGELMEVVLTSAVMMSLGRLANDAKKLFRAEDGSVGILKGETIESLRYEIAKEWADVMLYMLLMAHYSRINASAAIREVFNAKSEQLGFVERL